MRTKLFLFFDALEPPDFIGDFAIFVFIASFKFLIGISGALLISSTKGFSG
jgi:hypothetical protein